MSYGAFPPSVRRRVVVTGIGLVTPLGVGREATWNNLCVGMTGTTSIQEARYLLPSSIYDDKLLSEEEKERRRQLVIEAMPCKVAALVKSNVEAGQPSFAPTSRSPRSFLFCEYAVEEALTDAGLLRKPRNGETSGSETKTEEMTLDVEDTSKVGINIGTGIPSLDDVADVALAVYANPDHVSYSKINPLFVPKILGNSVAGVTAIRYKTTGPIGSGVAACATGALCIGEGAQWVRDGKADIVICGATESCVNAISLAGFSRMRALCTKYNTTPSTASRPFDATSGGFVMGEGSGILILEDYDRAVARSAPIYGELRGFGVSSDAHHIAAPHPEGRGARDCIQRALADGVNVSPNDICYVNAHATGTIGDKIELKAIREALSTEKRKTDLEVSSTKGALGHLLGAAGSVEAAIALLALKHSKIPPTANLTSPSIEANELNKSNINLVMGNQVVFCGLKASMSTSFGFGGVNTALLFTNP